MTRKIKTLLISVLTLGYFPAFAGDIGPQSLSDNAVKHSALYQEVEKYADLTLTNAQIKSLNTTPLTLVNAPGASLATAVTGAFFWIAPGSSAFAVTGAGVIDLKYTSASGNAVITSLLNATIVSSGQTQSWNPPIVVQPADNAAVTMSASQLIGQGTGLIKVRVFYKTIPTDYTAQY